MDNQFILGGKGQQHLFNYKEERRDRYRVLMDSEK